MGPGNPALCPLKRAQITLDFSYNSLILSPKTLEVASDQEAPDAGLAWRIRGKKMLITAEVGTCEGFSWRGHPRDCKRGSGHGERVGGSVRQDRRSREDAGLDPPLEFEALPPTSWIPQERTGGVAGRGGPWVPAFFRWGVSR